MLSLEHFSGGSRTDANAVKLTVTPDRLKEQVCAAICMRDEDLTADKSDAVRHFLRAYSTAEKLLGLVREAHSVGHPDYQCQVVPLGKSLIDADLSLAERSLQDRLVSWQRSLDVCRTKQPRMNLYSAVQVKSHQYIDTIHNLVEL